MYKKSNISGYYLRNLNVMYDMSIVKKKKKKKKKGKCLKPRERYKITRCSIDKEVSYALLKQDIDIDKNGGGGHVCADIE